MHRYMSRRLLLLVPAVLLTVTVAAPAAADTDTETSTLEVEGMACPACEATVEGLLGDLDGVHDANADRTEEAAVIAHDPTQVTAEDMAAAINEQTYYDASVADTAEPVDADQADDTGDDAGALGGGLLTAAAAGVLAVAGGVWGLARRRR